MLLAGFKRPASDSNSDAEDFDTRSTKCLRPNSAVAADYAIAPDFVPSINQYYFTGDYRHRLRVGERFELCLDPDSAVYGQPVPGDKFNEQLRAWVQKDVKFGYEESVYICWEDMVSKSKQVFSSGHSQSSQDRRLSSAVVCLPFADAENTTLILRYEYLPAELRDCMDFGAPKAIMFKSNGAFVALPRQGWTTFSRSEPIELRVVETVHDYVRTNAAHVRQKTLHLTSDRRRATVSFLIS